MPQNNLICAILGKTGTGKSFSTNWIIHQEYEKKRRNGIVVLDIRADHLNLLKKNDFHYLRISGEIFNNYNLDWVGILQKYPYVVIEPIKISREDYEKLADDISKGLLEVENRVFVLEEAHLALPVHTSIKRNLSVLITTGRKIGLDLYFTTQRAALVNSTAISQANIRISFLLDDLRDIDRMRGHFPPEIDLTKLKRFEFVAHNVFTHQFCKGTTNDLSVVNKIIWQK